MGASPNITLTATLQDFSGAAVGSAANPAKLCIALCGFGPQLPRITGTSLLARVGPVYLESPAGTFNVSLFGNDQITPDGTYYTVSLLDGQGNVVQSAAYILTGSGTFDLSSLAPVPFPVQPTPPTPNAAWRVITLGFNNGASVVPLGQGTSVTAVPYSGKITGYVITGVPSGSIQLDIRKANAAMPTAANSIVGINPPKLNSAQYVQSSTLTGWTTSVSPYDVFAVSVTSVTALTSFSVQLFVAVN